MDNKPWYKNNMLIKESSSNLLNLEQSTVDNFFNLDEQDLEEGLGKKLLTTAALITLGFAVFAGGINTKGTKDMSKFMSKEAARQGIELINEVNPGGNYAFFVDETTGIGKLTVMAKDANRAQMEVLNFCREHNIDLNKWNFDEISKGFYDTSSGMYITTFDVTKD